jgi:hypothetical protein
MSKNLSYSLEKQMIIWHVTEGKNNNKHDIGTPPAKRYRCGTACVVSPIVSADSINLPNPESGAAYNRMEVVNIMLEIPPEDVHIRAAALKVILNHQKKCNVPCCKSNIYSLLANHAKGQIISGDFRGGGRPQIGSDTDMKRIAESLDAEVGKTYDKSDVKIMIKKIQTEKLKKAGY